MESSAKFREQPNSKEKPQTFVWGFHLESGNVLLSRALFPMLYRSGELAQSRPFGRSLRFPTLRLPVSATGGGRLRSHWARTAGNLTKYNVALG